MTRQKKTGLYDPVRRITVFLTWGQSSGELGGLSNSTLPGGVPRPACPAVPSMSSILTDAASRVADSDRAMLVRCGSIAHRSGSARPEGLSHLGHWKGSIDADHPLPLLLQEACDLKVLLSDGRHLLDGLKDVPLGPLRGESFERRFRLHIQKQRHVRARYPFVEAPHPLEIACDGLIGVGREVSSVTHHPRARLDGRDHSAVHVIESISGWETGG